MKASQYVLICMAALVACLARHAANVEEAGSHFICDGLAYADFHASATAAIGGQQVPGRSARGASS